MIVRIRPWEDLLTVIRIIAAIEERNIEAYGVFARCLFAAIFQTGNILFLRYTLKYEY
jgi:hypothetical protein